MRERIQALIANDFKRLMTVREDYSPYGNAWESLPHDQARSRVYRWNEDGLAGICDRRQMICFALALWNERDPILKERIFGLTGNEGNHGEDVKEYYFYLDSTPTHSYMKYLYKYPQAEFPYANLVEENRRRGKNQPEYELLDTGVFNDDRYFDVFVEYAKADLEDILIKIAVSNRGPAAAKLRLLPTVWFRNTWSWGDGTAQPILKQASNALNPAIVSSPRTKPTPGASMESTTARPMSKMELTTMSYTAPKMPSIRLTPAQKRRRTTTLPWVPGKPSSLNCDLPKPT